VYLDALLLQDLAEPGTLRLVSGVQSLGSGIMAPIAGLRVKY